MGDLPLDNAQINKTLQSTPQNSEPKKILIVEDEKSYRDVLSEKLKSDGFVVFEAENGQIAIDLLKTQEVDIILLDMVMPQMDGPTFCYHLRHTLNKSDIPIIILTNLTETAYPDGVADFVIKSNVSLEEVVQKVRDNIPIKL